MTPINRNRLLAVGALLVAGAGLAFISLGNIGENLVYYWSPSETIAQSERAEGATIRLGGVVKKGSIEWNEQHTVLKFRVADDVKDTSPSVMVRATEIPPQMFREGIGVVVEGTYGRDQVFTSNRLMVNHSNEYRPPAEGEDRKQWQDTMLEGSAQGESP